jgi:hypothetical protein
MSELRKTVERLPAWIWAPVGALAVLAWTRLPAPASAQVADARVQRQEMISELKMLNAQVKATNALLAEIRAALEKSTSPQR